MWLAVYRDQMPTVMAWARDELTFWPILRTLLRDSVCMTVAEDDSHVRIELTDTQAGSLATWLAEHTTATLVCAGDWVSDEFCTPARGELHTWGQPLFTLSVGGHGTGP